MDARGTPVGGGPRTGRVRSVFLRKASVAAVLTLAVLALGGTASAATGELDPTFGENGKVRTDFGASSSSFESVSAIAVQSDGKVVATGQADRPEDSPSSDEDFALARYNGDGSLDPSFGGDGRVTTDFVVEETADEDGALDVAMQPDGKVVVAGYTDSNPEEREHEAPSGGSFALARYTPDGSLDPSFGGDGKVTTAVGPHEAGASAVAVQPDGRVVAAGYSLHSCMDLHSCDSSVTLTRYDPDGSLDATFDGDGKMTTNVDPDTFDRAEANDLAVQPDGKIVTANDGIDNEGFVLTRFNRDGSPDASFGDAGKAVTEVSGVSDEASALTTQPDGRIVVVGDAFYGSAGSFFALVRLDEDGSPDASFGGDGKVTTAIGPCEGRANDVAVQPDGKIVAAGSSSCEYYAGGPSRRDFALARLNEDGSPDSTFGGGDGTAATDFGDTYGASAYAVAVQQGGKVVAAGESNSDFALARYEAESPDNAPPVAEDASVTARTGTSRKVTVKATDADGDRVTFEIPNQPEHGRAHVIGETSCVGTIPKTCSTRISYISGARYAGPDSFGFRANDVTEDGREANVTVTVKSRNRAPVARDDRATTRENERVRLDVLKNDSDPDGDRLTVGRSTQGRHGEVRCSAGGRCVYVPDRGFNGRDAFTYKAEDGQGGSDTATARVTVRRGR